jgi:ADP-heptose:LPS heptosyltransferase
MKLCKAIVCNDSGLMHTASATGTKVIALFGSTVKEFGFAPYNCSNLILENNSLTCRPCSHIGRIDCPKKHFDCMKSIKPEFVFEKLISFLTI